MSIDDWFMTHILPFEGQLNDFLNANWRGDAPVEGIRTEIYVRVYKAAKVSRPEQPRVLLMATARHLVFEEIRKSDVIDLNVLRAANTGRDLLDTHTATVLASMSQENALLQEFVAGLNKLERNVFLSFAAHGYSLAAISKRFGVSKDKASRTLARLLDAWADASHSTATTVNDNAADDVAGRTIVG